MADARAICPDLITRPADLYQDATTLVNLRRWTQRYSPIIARDGVDGLIADITGVPHLFRGESALRNDLHNRLSNIGFTISSAIAATRGAAFALARHGGGILVEEDSTETLGRLPISALRIQSALAQSLNRVGLHKIADLLALPRAPLAQRFGPDLILRLDQALGHQAEPISMESDLPHFGVRINFPEPIGLQTDVLSGLKKLLERLCTSLARYDRGARRLRLYVSRVDHKTAIVEIGLARPMRSSTHIFDLFTKSVNELDAKFGIDAMRLVAYVTESLLAEQINPSNTQKSAELIDLFSRLGNRIGFHRVQRILFADNIIPERSFHLVPAAYSQPDIFHQNSQTLRPIIIFPPETIRVNDKTPPSTPPVRFYWRRLQFNTLRATGPERITPEWWSKDPSWRSGLRDYWYIETREGPRIWLFNAPKVCQWSAQGIFL